MVTLAELVQADKGAVPLGRASTSVLTSNFSNTRERALTSARFVRCTLFLRNTGTGEQHEAYRVHSF